jgi:8-oxo-dGTP pyrophosphatase MutT (NUDIX family)
MTDLPCRRSCCGLSVSDGRILLAEHHIGDGSSVWVGPGRGVEAGESLIDALTRELHEETGIQITEDHAPQPVWVQQRWWTISEIEAAHSAGVLFSPRNLPRLLHTLFCDGPPSSTIAIGL